MKTGLVLYIALVFSQFIVAFICGPHSCEWGNTVYLGYGFMGLLLIFFFPLFKAEWSLTQRFGYAFGFSLLWLLMWVLGFIAGDLRIMCRLF